MVYHTLDAHAFPWLLLLLSAGFLIRAGDRLRRNRPASAAALSQLGRSVGVLTFYAIISNHLPQNICWVPWLSCTFTLLAQLILLQDRVMHREAPGLQGHGQRMMDWHPNYEPIDAMLGHVIAVIAVLTNPYSQSVSSAPNLVLFLSAGFLIWAGDRLRLNRPALAAALSQLGRSIGVLTFSAVISNHLPQSISWVPWLSCALTLLAQLILLQDDRLMHHEAPGIEGQGQRMMDWHPNYGPIEAMLGRILIAVIAVLTNPYNPSVSSAAILVLLSTFFGVAAIYILPEFCSRVWELEGAIVLLIFFGLVFMLLPASLAWVPLVCFALPLTALWSQM